MDVAYLLFTLMCPLSMVALVGWWVWSMRRSGGGSSGSSGGSGGKAPARSVAEEGEITRMRAQLDQLDAQARDQNAPSSNR